MVMSQIMQITVKFRTTRASLECRWSVCFYTRPTKQDSFSLYFLPFKMWINDTQSQILEESPSMLLMVQW